MATNPAAVMQVIVTANTAKANSALAATDKQLKKTAATGSTVSSRMATVGKASVASIAAIGVVSTKVAIDFDRNMRNVNSIAQLPEKSLAKLSERVRSLAGETAQSPQTLAQGLYDLVSSGFDANESMEILAKSATAATAGLTDTATSTKAVAAVLNAYRLPAKKAGDVSDVLFRTVDRGVISFETLAGSIGMALPASAALGVNVNSLGAAIATLTKQGQSGESAVVNINAAMTALFKPTVDMKAALKELGYENSEALIKAKGFQGGLQELIDTTDGTTASVGKLFSNVRAQRAAFGLTGKNAQGAAQDLKGLENAAGATDKALSQQSQSVSYMWNKLKAEAEDLAIGIGNELIPTIKEMFDIISDPKLTLDEKVDAILDRTLSVIEDKGPQFVETGGKIMLMMGKGMVHAFADANPLGKLFIGMGLVRLLGGPGALGAAGSKVMSYVFQKQAVAQAAGAGLSNTTVPVPGLKSKFGSTLMRAGKVLGGAALAYGVFNGLSTALTTGRNTRGLEGALDNFATGAFRSFGIDIGQTTAEEFDESFRQTIADAGEAGLGKQAIITPEIDDQAMEAARKAMAEINSTDNENLWIDGDFTTEYNKALADIMEGTKARRKTVEEMFSDTWDAMTPDEQEFAKRFRGALVEADRFQDKFHTYLSTTLADDDPVGFKKAAMSLDENFTLMQRGMFTNLKTIRKNLHENTGFIARTTEKGSVEAREAMSKNYRLAARNIGKAMDKGEISVKKGTKAQERLLRKAKVVDATQDQARRMANVWAKSMDKTKDFTGKGVDNIIKELKLMSPAARETAQSTWLQLLREAARNNPKLKDEFRDLRSKIVDEFGTARKDSDTQAQILYRKVMGSFDNLGDGVGSVLKTTETNLNKALSALNVKTLTFGVLGGGGGKGDGGKKPGKNATGATYVPGIQGGDRHVLSLNGQPIAHVESGEKISILNREAAKSEMQLNAMVPRYAEGGVIEQALGPYTIPPVQYDPNHAGGNSHLHLDFFTVAQALAYGHKMQGMGWNISEYTPKGGNPWNFGPITTQHQSPGHYDGTAFDANTGADETKAEVEAVVRMLGGGGVSMGGAAAQLAKAIIKGPAGPLTDFLGAVNNKVFKEAESYLEQHTPTGTTSYDGGYVAGGDGAVAAQMGRILMRTGWNRSGAAGVIGNAYRESLWNPASVGTGGGGLFGFTTSPISLADLQNYARGHRKPWTDVGIQMQFMQEHLTGSVKQAVMNAGSPESAAERFMTLWERPGIPALEERQAAARQAYNMKSWSRGGLLQLAKGGLLDVDKFIDKTYDATDPKDGKGMSAAEQRQRLSKDMKRKIAKLSELGTGKNPYYATDGSELAGKMATARENVDMFAEYASNAGARNKDDSLGLFRGQNEMYWLLKELDALKELRNRVLEAEKEAKERREKVVNMLNRTKDRRKDWLRDLNKAKRQLGAEGKTPADWKKGDLDPVKASVKEWNEQKDKKRLDLYKKFEKMGGKLPGNRLWGEDGTLLTPEAQPNAFPNVSAMGAVVKLLTENAIPNLTTERTQMGSAVALLSDQLNTIQGAGGPGLPNRYKKQLPPIGTLGGEIFTAQSDLETAIETAQGVIPQVDYTAQIENLNTLLQQANMRTAVAEAETRAFAATPVLGAFEKGGTAAKYGQYLVGEKEPEVLTLPAGARVSPDTSDFGGNTSVQVLIKGTIVSDAKDPVEVLVNDKRFKAAVKQVTQGQAKSAGRPLPGRGGR